MRSFEYPLHIFGAGAGAAVLLLLFALWVSSWFTAGMALATAAATAGALWLKSWPEEVRVAVWSCDEHKDELPTVEAVVDDAELHLLLPNRRIAQYARDALKQSRTSRRAYDTDAPPGAPASSRSVPLADETPSRPSSTDVPGSERYVSPHGGRRTAVPDLPPIEIDDGPLLADESSSDTAPATSADEQTPASEPPQGESDAADASRRST
ncbi:MAG: hypothetical protein R3C10_15540 [Pirellulales bacterium]